MHMIKIARCHFEVQVLSKQKSYATVYIQVMISWSNNYHKNYSNTCKREAGQHREHNPHTTLQLLSTHTIHDKKLGTLKMHFMHPSY